METTTEIEHLLRQGEAVSHIFFPMLYRISHAVAKEQAQAARKRQLQLQEQQDACVGRTSSPSRDRTSKAPAEEKLSDDPIPALPIRIPHTVLHSYRKPVQWFYFDEHTKTIKQRPQSDLHTSVITEEFTKTCDVPASLSTTSAARAWYVSAAGDQEGQLPAMLTTAALREEKRMRDEERKKQRLGQVRAELGLSPTVAAKPSRSRSETRARRHLATPVSPFHQAQLATESKGLFFGSAPSAAGSPVATRRRESVAFALGSPTDMPTAATAKALVPARQDVSTPGVSVAPRPAPNATRVTSQKVATDQGLVQFLQIPKPKGVLQSIVYNRPDPDGALRNVLIQCVYTPSSFTVERVASKHLMSDTFIALEDRFSAPTALGPRVSPYSRTPVKTPSLGAHFHAVCQMITHHAASSCGIKIQRLELTCRVDNHTRPVVLWCDRLDAVPESTPHLVHMATPAGTTARAALEAPTTSKEPAMKEKEEGSETDGVSSEKAPSRNDSFVSRVLPPKQSCTQQTYDSAARAVPLPDDLEELFIGEAALSRRELPQVRSRPCPLCQESTLIETMPRVQKRYAFLSLSLLNPDKIHGWDDTVPPCVILLHPTISQAEFSVLRQLDVWLDEFVPFCQPCVVDLGAALENLTKHRVPAPLWLNVDERFAYGVKKPAPGQQQPWLSQSSANTTAPAVSAALAAVATGDITLLQLPGSQHQGTKDASVLQAADTRLRLLRILQRSEKRQIQLQPQDALKAEREKETLSSRHKSICVASPRAVFRNSGSALAHLSPVQGTVSLSNGNTVPPEHSGTEADLYVRDRFGVFRIAGRGFPSPAGVETAKVFPVRTGLLDEAAPRDALCRALDALVSGAKPKEPRRLTDPPAPAHTPL